ncbi:hypothetical protein RISK_003771 [Rhodopirellula islandica]|uniref:Uncharacterized protein n=1 Tax=Rhodopirellula islandica TaxID=595434 RepID=A0A0J1BC15_RHOIS|nr:hypothetical protein RISK_003771 [Rhodopirellula islandica]
MTLMNGATEKLWQPFYFGALNRPQLRGWSLGEHEPSPKSR